MKPPLGSSLWIIVLFAMCSVTRAEQEPAEAANEKTPSVEVVDLTIHPAPAPRPALKHRLLPQFLDQVPGNAAPLYMKGFLLSRKSGIQTYTIYEQI